MQRGAHVKSCTEDDGASGSSEGDEEEQTTEQSPLVSSSSSVRCKQRTRRPTGTKMAHEEHKYGAAGTAKDGRNVLPLFQPKERCKSAPSFVPSGDHDAPTDTTDGQKENDRRSGKSLWLALRNRVRSGSFQIQNFGGNDSDDDDGNDKNMTSWGTSDEGAGPASAAASEGSHSHKSTPFSSAHGGRHESSASRKSSHNGSGPDSETKEIGLPYEFSVLECVFAITLYLVVGVISFSFVFEHWSLLDSLYFTVVTFTTLGYGDLVPTTVLGRAFTTFFAFVGIAFLGIALGVVGSRIVEGQRKALENANIEAGEYLTKAFKNYSTDNNNNKQGCNDDDGGYRLDSFFKRDKHQTDETDSDASSFSDDEESYQSSSSSERSSRDHVKVTKAKAALLDWKITGKLLLRYSPAMTTLLFGSLIISYKEGWSWADSVYYCIVTASTIGYGDYVPKTSSMKWFAIFYIPLAVGAMGHVLGMVAKYIIEGRQKTYQKQLWSHDLKMEDLHAMDWNDSGAVTELEYVEFMLLMMKKVDKDFLRKLHDQFRDLDITGTGTLTKRDLQLMAKRRLRRVRNKLSLSSYKYKLTNELTKSKPSGEEETTNKQEEEH